MEKLHRCKAQTRKYHNPNGYQPSRWFKQVEIKRREIPDGRKAAEVIVRSLHFSICEI